MVQAGQPNKGQNWQHWVHETYRQAQYGQLLHGKTMVVAVSGGPDSMLLMHWLAEVRHLQDNPMQIIVAHVHHGFRLEESQQEALLVKQAAEELGLMFEMTQVDSPGYAKKHHLNPQAAARELRYAFLKSVANKYNSPAIALAHHADDQAETVLMHMLRGAGSSGLRGISWIREEEGIRYVRPFLHVRKQELVDWCQMRGIAYALDSSNQKRAYLRNRLRLDIMPLLEQENPRITEALVQLAETMAAEDDWQQQHTVELFRSHVHSFGVEVKEDTGALEGTLKQQYQRFAMQYTAGCLMKRDVFLSVHVALQRRLIKLILNYLFLEAEQADFSTIERLRLRITEPKTTWREEAGNKVIAIREYDHIAWLSGRRDGAEPASVHCHIERGSGEMFYSSYPSKIVWNEMAVRQMEPDFLGDKFDAMFDADAIQWPISVRTRRQGDRMRVKGLNGSKKVQDMFVDAKVPSSLRDAMPIVEDASGQILWLPGIRRSDIALIGPATRSVVHIRFEPVS